MLSSDGSEFEVFFDSAEVLSIDEPFVVEEGLDSEALEFRVWSGEPESVEERRGRFLQKMGLFEFVPDEQKSHGSSSDLFCFERISDRSDDASSTSGSSVDEDEENLQFRGREQNCGSNSMSDEEFDTESVLEPNPNKEDDVSAAPATPPEECSNEDGSFTKKKTKKWLLKCFAGKRGGKKGTYNLRYEESKLNSPTVSRVKVQANKKSHQELSATYKVQELQGHKGIIWAMKFSPDGKFLASGGEDGVIRIWQVTSADSTRASIIHEVAESLNDGKSGLARKRISCQPSVLLPEKVFHIEETPARELRGHTGDVLDLAWSDSNFLLSASKDKTVRLWRMDSDQCLHVFHHNNYVTCVQFNPTNANYFISGSIDGKARIWGLSQKRVVAWADVRDAISAVCYQPDGKGFIVGSITGTCRFYETSGNDVQMEARMRVHGQKKTSGNRITGIQFCPDNSKRVLVASDDSKLRILDGSRVVHKFKGLSKSGSQMSASFTSLGKHIVSVGEDFKVYLWNYDGPTNAPPSQKHVKSLRSCEHFHSHGVSVAAAWPGTAVARKVSDDLRRSLRQVRCSDHFSRSCRVSATWPEEKLPCAGDQNYHNTLGVQNDDNVPRCKNSRNRVALGGSSSDAWGLVIVTAGWDGTIRTFHNYGLHVWLER